MSYNFILIPLISIAVAYLYKKYTASNFLKWYQSLKKPLWLPGDKTIYEALLFVYALFVIGVMWFWNIPAFTWWHYIFLAVISVFILSSLMWVKMYFEKNSPNAAKKYSNYIIYSLVILLVVIVVKSLITIPLVMPFMLTVYLILKSAHKTHENK